ncbi:hypothetical protein D3C85_1656840 [compost metagenome]
MFAVNINDILFHLLGRLKHVCACPLPVSDIKSHFDGYIVRFAIRKKPIEIFYTASACGLIVLYCELNTPILKSVIPKYLMQRL